VPPVSGIGAGTTTGCIGHVLTGIGNPVASTTTLADTGRVAEPVVPLVTGYAKLQPVGPVIRPVEGTSGCPLGNTSSTTPLTSAFAGVVRTHIPMCGTILAYLHVIYRLHGTDFTPLRSLRLVSHSADLSLTRQWSFANSVASSTISAVSAARRDRGVRHVASSRLPNAKAIPTRKKTPAAIRMTRDIRRRIVRRKIPGTLARVGWFTICYPLHPLHAQQLL